MKTFTFIAQIENTTDEHGETPAKQGISVVYYWYLPCLVESNDL